MAKFRFSKIAIIAGDGDLAEQVCLHFRSHKTYLPFFEAPLKRLVEYGVFTADCIRVSNAIRYLGAKTILLLGCGEEIIVELKQRLPSCNIIELDSFDENALAKLSGYKRKKTQSVVEFSPDDDIPSGHIIAVEDNDTLSKVAARNLAKAIDGYVVVIPSASREDAQDTQDYMRIWATAETSLGRIQAKNTLFSLLKKRLSKLASTNSKSISFITKGIPYGILPFDCPTTHYFHFPLLGWNIIRGMMKSILPNLYCTSAYLVDPGELSESEFENLRKIFLSKGYIIRKSFHRNAKVREVDYCTQHLPLDLIFYSTHCGEVDGKRVKERFITSDGKEHIIVYDLATSFAPEPGTDLIEVLEFVRLVSLDGVDWSDKAGKKRIDAGNLMKQYMEKRKGRKINQKDIALIETSDIKKIKYSNALKMTDFNFIPTPTELGNHRYPLVFNNACSSWQELALRFSVAGACVYIGTSIDIPNPVAIDVVTKFASLLAKGRALGHSLFSAQKSYISQLKYTPYLMHGYLFTRCLPFGSREKNAKYFLQELAKSIKKWDEHIKSNQKEEIIKNSKKISSFLRNEIDNFK